MSLRNHDNLVYKSKMEQDASVRKERTLRLNEEYELKVKTLREQKARYDSSVLEWKERCATLFSTEPNYRCIFQSFSTSVLEKRTNYRRAASEAITASHRKEAHDAYCLFCDMAILAPASEFYNVVSCAPIEGSSMTTSELESIAIYWKQETTNIRARYWGDV
jgi:hypothetical protein